MHAEPYDFSTIFTKHVIDFPKTDDDYPDWLNELDAPKPDILEMTYEEHGAVSALCRQSMSHEICQHTDFRRFMAFLSRSFACDSYFPHVGLCKVETTIRYQIWESK